MTSNPGSVPHGLLVHPDGENLIYPLGCTVVIENIKTHEQNFLSGHTNDVSCLAVSKSGKYVASGQVQIFLTWPCDYRSIESWGSAEYFVIEFTVGKNPRTFDRNFERVDF